MNIFIEYLLSKRNSTLCVVMVVQSRRRGETARAIVHSFLSSFLNVTFEGAMGCRWGLRLSVKIRSKLSSLSPHSHSLLLSTFFSLELSNLPFTFAVTIF